MTTAPDPIDDVRAELARMERPTGHELDVQRARMEDAITRSAPVARAKRRRSRWLPASGVAVAVVGCALFVAFALLPSSGRDGATRDTSGTLRLVTATAGGAFRGLDLDTASAAEVLRAAGRAAADGTPEPGPGDWTFIRMESGRADFPTTTLERWTSPDGERSFSISTVNITNPEHGDVGRTYSLHYEYLEQEVLGDVSWREMPDGSTERRANWHDDAGDGSGDIARMVELTRLLRDVQDSDGVRRALDQSVEGAELEFRDGTACGTTPRYSSCSSSGFVPQAKGLDEEASKRLYLTGQLLTVRACSDISACQWGRGVMV